MNQSLIGLAFAAGLVAAVNPCGFAMLPAYLVLVVRGTGTGATRSPLVAVGRALAATLGMALGFVTVFGVFGALTISAAATVQRYLPYATVLVGVVLIGLGAWLLSGREITAAPLGARWAPTLGLGSMYGYGVSYAMASLSCTVGPFLAVTGAALRTGSALHGAVVYVAYVAGLTLVVGALAVGAATASSALLGRLRRLLPYVNRIGGALLVLVGLYVGYYGLYEVRLLTADGDPDDAVIAAAGRVQGWLAGWVHQHSGWPWLAALLLVPVCVLAAAKLWRCRHDTKMFANDTTMVSS
ncbi:cytochrome c biogenesis CcdA family protein [Mycobacterium vicinigordonae]|uniref:Cytochrome c biogenesis protein CcdA n=1 Tax=Mycobacterium vicinigordonae TaxID=1719132 RepID=A0A7D6E1X5_9MYCO|nr:cytochrome c biogenesis CcdA family protein [Mycobacterium vicinigordonae]QLL09209.1 cytochrome c biogenesis protein CcdA [Mycobacterium vicinigordonae]